VALSLAPADQGATGPADNRSATPPQPDPDPARPAARRDGGWRSRTVATMAYLLTVAGLLAVAASGNDSGPISRSEGDPAAAPGLVSVIERVLQAEQGSQP
jgi:hypothetical protein